MIESIGSLSSHNLNAKDYVNFLKKILYIAYKSHVLSNVKSFCLLSLTDKTITKANLGHNDTFEMKFKKVAVMVHIHQASQNLVISHCCFAEDSIEVY